MRGTAFDGDDAENDAIGADREVEAARDEDERVPPQAMIPIGADWSSEVEQVVFVRKDELAIESVTKSATQVKTIA